MDLEIAILLGIAAICVVAIVFVYARNQDPSPFEKKLSDLAADVSAIKSVPPMDDEKIKELVNKVDAAATNASLLRLEIESLKSKIAFPQQSEITFKQAKPFEVFLVPTRPAKKKKPEAPHSTLTSPTLLPRGFESKAGR